MKVIVGYATVCLLTGAMAGLFMMTFNRYQRSNHLIFSIEQMRGQELALQAALYAELQSVRALIRNPDLQTAQGVQKEMKKVRVLTEKIRAMEERLADQLEELEFPGREFLYLARFQEDLDRFDSAFDAIHSAIIARSDRNDFDAAALSDEFESKLEEWTGEMNVAWSHDIGQAIAHIQSQKQRTAVILLGMVVANVAVSLLLSVLLVTSLRRLMVRLEEGMRRVASGDYDHPVKPCRDPEMNYLVENFNRMTRELKDLEDMRIDFVSMLTHDMKSPLSVIKMYAGILREKNPEDPRAAETIARSADRMLHLVDNFLDFARSESVAPSANLRPLSLDLLISRVLEDCEILARSRNVTLTSAFPDTLPPVLADEEKIERVLHNLVTNAIKYNKPEGRVVVRARSDDGKILVEVEDTGMGISASDQSRIFVKYSRAERTQHIKGTGLGLVVSRDILRAHGSDLTFRSEEGKGTVFSFTLRQHAEKGALSSQVGSADMPSHSRVASPQ